LRGKARTQWRTGNSGLHGVAIAFGGGLCGGDGVGALERDVGGVGAAKGGNCQSKCGKLEFFHDFPRLLDGVSELPGQVRGWGI